MSGSCAHENFRARADISRICEVEGGPITAYCAELTIRCTVCGLPFVFLGLNAGSSPSVPTVSWDGTELRAPIMPSRKELHQ